MSKEQTRLAIEQVISGKNLIEFESVEDLIAQVLIEDNMKIRLTEIISDDKIDQVRNRYGINPDDYYVEIQRNVIEPMTLVKLRSNVLGSREISSDEILIFVGEIKNVSGSGIFINVHTGQMFSGLNIDDFRTVYENDLLEMFKS